MKIPSRFMPKYAHAKPSTGSIAWIFLVILAFSFIYVFWKYPQVTSLVLVALLILAQIEIHRTRKARRALALSRAEESICDFARAFDCRVIDTWIVRAVYEQLQEHLGLEYRIPIRSTDTFGKDLQIDSEDLDMDIVQEIAQRTGRTLENPEKNPYYDKINTVGDLVYFFNAQPKATR